MDSSALIILLKEMDCAAEQDADERDDGPFSNQNYGVRSGLLLVRYRERLPIYRL